MRSIGVLVLLLGLLGIPSYSGASLPVPAGVAATEGTYSDIIVVTWDAVPDASGYEIWRSSYTCEGTEPCEPYFIIMEVVDSPIYFDSEDIMPFGEVFEYKILAFNYLEWSKFSPSVFGYVLEDSPSYGPELPENKFETGGCFIATAAYGLYWEPHVRALRQFRDLYLLTNKPGARFVEGYYRYSPPIAHYISKHERLRSVVRIGLLPLAGFSWLSVNYGILVASALLLSALTLFVGGVCYMVKTKEFN
jgi:hypothetical protein